MNEYDLIWKYCLYRCNQVKMRSYWIRVDSISNMTGALSEERNLDTVQTDREGGHVKTEADIGVIHLQTKEHQELSVTTRM